jgi:hypothetical protein
VWSPEIVVARWIEDTRHSLRAIEASTGVSRSKLSKLGTGSATLTVSDLISVSSFLNRDPRSVFLKNVSLDVVDGAYKDLGSKLGAAVMETVKTRGELSRHQLSIEDVINWHDSTCGHMYRSSDISSHMVAFKPLLDINDELKVVEVGENSLAWSKLKSATDGQVYPEDVERFLSGSITEPARGSLFQGYIETHLSQGRQYYDRKLIHLTNSTQATVTSYFTVLLSGFWHDDAPVIWNFSKEISNRLASEAELAELLDSLGSQ